MTVVFDQVATGKAGSDLLDYLFHLIVFKPGIDNLEMLTQHRQHDHLGEVLPIAVAGVLFTVKVDYVPAHPVELIE